MPVLKTSVQVRLTGQGGQAYLPIRCHSWWRRALLAAARAVAEPTERRGGAPPDRRIPGAAPGAGGRSAPLVSSRGPLAAPTATPLPGISWRLRYSPGARVARAPWRADHHDLHPCPEWRRGAWAQPGGHAM